MESSARAAVWRPANHRRRAVRLDDVFDPAFVEACARLVATRRRAQRCRGFRLSRVAIARPRCSIVNAAVVPLREAEARRSRPSARSSSSKTSRPASSSKSSCRLSEKMASIGLLAAGVAHEVNTPLTGISSFTQMLLEGADPAGSAHAAARKDRAPDVPRREDRQRTADAVASGVAAIVRTFDVNAVITDVLGLLEHQFETHRIRVRRELSDTPVMVLGLEHKLQQVFLNLFLNARDAMPKGGWLSISDTDRRRSQSIAEVSDTGSGIPSEYLARIYDPFFTTKAIGQGTGLGLSITYGIVREHEGSDRVRQRDRPGHAVHSFVSGRGARAVVARGPGHAGPGCRTGARSSVMRRNGSILVVDDEEIMREILEALLAREGYHVRLASSGEEGLELARSLPFDAAIVDVMMPGMDGLAMLEELKKLDDDLPVLMVTAFASVETAITAMKRGAFDYITKPFKNDEVLVVVRNAVERRQLMAENTALRQNLQAQYQKFAGIIGRSPRMKQVFDLIIQAAPSRSTILITGESGTGKELVARAIHSNSPRADRAFVTVNSGNLPPDLLESTLFGHVKGAFTGAIYPKKGLCDLADKGSIFFDEIGNIPPDTQAKLLRVMQEREFMRLGGMETIKVDVRIIAATNCDLRQMVERRPVPRGSLLPAARHQHLPAAAARAQGRHPVSRAALPREVRRREQQARRSSSRADALDLLMEYDWPGNVRELENVIERAVVLEHGRSHRPGSDSRARPIGAGVPHPEVRRAA